MFPALEGKFLTTGSPGNFTLKPRFLPLAPLSLMSYTGPIWITHSLALGILMLSVLGLNSQHILGRLASCLTSGKSITQVQPEGIKIERKELSLKSLLKKKNLAKSFSNIYLSRIPHKLQNEMEILRTQGPAGSGPKYISLLAPPHSSQPTSILPANQPRVKNLPANAGDVGSVPHAVEQLSPCTTISLRPRACALDPVLHNKRNRCNEKPVHRKESSSCLLQLEKDHTWQKRPTAAINKKI